MSPPLEKYVKEHLGAQDSLATSTNDKQRYNLTIIKIKKGKYLWDIF